MHRLISDLSVFASKKFREDIVVAGDLNILYGHGEHGDTYWAGRYETVFSRMAALGLAFVGPQAPHGRQAEPWPDELPRNSNNVPTYRTKRQTPATCTRQLDFVFASQGLAPRLRVRAVPSENLIRWIRSRKENRIMIETDGDLLQTFARIYVRLLSFA